MRYYDPRFWMVAAAVLGLVACTRPGAPALEVTGTLVGSDGEPMPAAHVQLSPKGEMRPPGQPAPQDEVGLEPDAPPEPEEVGADGSFRVLSEEPGVFELHFTGLHHQPRTIPLIVNEPTRVEVHVRLAAVQLPDSLLDLRIRGDFNDFDLDSAWAMSPGPDGSFAVRVPVDADTLVYELLQFEGDRPTHSVPATQADRWAVGVTGSYTPVLEAHEDTVTIAYDPHLLPGSKEPFLAEFADTASRTARLATIDSELERCTDTWNEARRGARGPGQEPSHDWSAEVADLRARLAEEPDSVVRQALWLSLMKLMANGAEVEPGLASEALAGLPPTSLVWSVWREPESLIGAAFQARNGAPDATDGEAGPVPPPWLEELVAYMDEGVAVHPDAEVRASMLQAVAEACEESGEDERGQSYYDRLQEEYPVSAAATLASMGSSYRRIRVGKLVPDFSFRSLEDSTVVFSRESLEGTLYLLDFWATWCGPCVAELPTLEEVYKELRPRGFEVLSVSLDEEREDIDAFRRDRFPMPWLHAQTPDGFRDASLTPFEVWGIPKLILVDPEGNILATEGRLRGDRLRPTVIEALEGMGG